MYRGNKYLDSLRKRSPDVRDEDADTRDAGDINARDGDTGKLGPLSE